MNLYGLDYIASAATLCRLWMFSNATSKSRIWAWWLGFFATGLWLITSALIGSWAMFVMNVVYLVVSIRGLMKEKRALLRL